MLAASVTSLTVVPLILLCHKLSHRKRTTRTAFELSRDCPSHQITKCGDGVWNVTLHSSGGCEACSLRVGETLLIERSFFIATTFETLTEEKAVGRDTQC